MAENRDETRGDANSPGDRPTSNASGGSAGRGVGWWVAGGLLVLAIVAVWFFAVYDSAEGRCNRGDLGACVVVFAKQSAAASASAAVASASAAAVAASVEASSFATSGCTVGPGDGSHDVRITVSDSASAKVQQSTCQQLIQSGWTVASDVPGATQVCQVVRQDGNTFTVTDTGGQLYGGQDCTTLNQGGLPTWPSS